MLGPSPTLRDFWEDARYSPPEAVLRRLGVVPDDGRVHRWQIPPMRRDHVALRERLRNADDPITTFCERVRLGAAAPVGSSADNYHRLVAALFSRLLAFEKQVRATWDGLLFGIDFVRDQVPVEAWPGTLPAGWTVRTLVGDGGRSFSALYPPGAAADDWTFRVPDDE
jgi:hypothetical protein